MVIPLVKLLLFPNLVDSHHTILRLLPSDDEVSGVELNEDSTELDGVLTEPKDIDLSDTFMADLSDDTPFNCPDGLMELQQADKECQELTAKAVSEEECESGEDCLPASQQTVPEVEGVGYSLEPDLGEEFFPLAFSNIAFDENAVAWAELQSR
ncbi:hypothetical protein Pcinc_022622 [Petrolisthes cinctipes]|uniref:Uncharacterized protein n=2 Tax=Petrolisthes cinctipes TaxID=88211 RepID=A0AAE1KFM0_PETCI|nr:hypothetical protein Pcinc_022622 [Petrolisthes cinctipes]